MNTYKYPLMMKSLISGIVVEFVDLKEGIVIKGDSENPSGHYSDRWFSHTRKDRWKPINPIWLQQKKK